MRRVDRDAKLAGIREEVQTRVNSALAVALAAAANGSTLTVHSVSTVQRHVNAVLKEPIESAAVPPSELLPYEACALGEDRRPERGAVERARLVRVRDAHRRVAVLRAPREPARARERARVEQRNRRRHRAWAREYPNASCEPASGTGGGAGSHWSQR